MFNKINSPSFRSEFGIRSCGLRLHFASHAWDENSCFTSERHYVRLFGNQRVAINYYLSVYFISASSSNILFYICFVWWSSWGIAVYILRALCAQSCPKVHIHKIIIIHKIMIIYSRKCLTKTFHISRKCLIITFQTSRKYLTITFHTSRKCVTIIFHTSRKCLTITFHTSWKCLTITFHISRKCLTITFHTSRKCITKTFLIFTIFKKYFMMLSHSFALLASIFVLSMGT